MQRRLGWPVGDGRHDGKVAAMMAATVKEVWRQRYGEAEAREETEDLEGEEDEEESGEDGKGQKRGRAAKDGEEETSGSE